VSSPPRAVEVVRGASPLLLVAPHGGRRDPARLPWTRGGLRTNDLRTAELTRELAVATAASALVNDGIDRNDVDLNRIGTAHARAPHFLEALAGLLEETIDRHGRALVLAIHGWNVVQPVVDLGIGYCPGRHAPGEPPGPSVSAAFIAGALAPLVRALEARGIAAPVGVRYPGRGRENLLQLFTERHRDDARPLVRRLAGLGRHADAVQLELGLPLRWPGPWRGRFVDAIVQCLPALLGRWRAGDALSTPAAAPTPAAGCSLEFASDAVCGLVAVDRAGGRLLLFDEPDRVALFTGERIGGEASHDVGGLSLAPLGEGAHRLRYDGPLLRFPDTAPFLDLEAGLAAATLTAADVLLEFRPRHDGGCPFGTVRGTIRVAGRPVAANGVAVLDESEARERAGERIAFDLGGDERLLLRAVDGGPLTGFACRAGIHVPVDRARFGIAADGRRATLEVRFGTGEERTIHAEPVHCLPVVRGGTTPPVRVEFAAWRLAGAVRPAGWRFARA
jgi:hypothetical protein